MVEDIPVQRLTRPDALYAFIGASGVHPDDLREALECHSVYAILAEALDRLPEGSAPRAALRALTTTALDASVGAHTQLFARAAGAGAGAGAELRGQIRRIVAALSAERMRFQSGCDRIKDARASL